ncbi:hypothetical protein HDV03_001323 [Kappamyces sp. JEL0829]|nr:hypothetical protein HDV03_001323 [Kappamyces sp. JEL0829]
MHVCDFQYSLQGCSNYSDQISVNTVLIALHSLSLVLYSIYPLRHVYYEVILKKRRFVFNDHDAMSLFGALYHCIVITHLLNMRYFQKHDLAIPPSTLKTIVRVNIVMDMLSYIVGGLGGSSISMFIVKTTTGSNLYDPIEWRGRKINPIVALKLWRAMVLVYLITAYSCFCTFGLESLELYVLWRRATLLFLAGLSGIISSGVLLFFGLNLFKKLDENESRKKVKSIRFKEQLKIMKIGIYLGAFAYYIPIALSTALIVLLLEVYAENHQALLYSKIATRLCMWLFSTAIVVYALYKSFTTHTLTDPSGNVSSEEVVRGTISKVLAAEPTTIKAKQSITGMADTEVIKSG